MSNTGLDEEKEIELVHEKEIGRTVEQRQPATVAQHYLHPDLKFVSSGDISHIFSALRGVGSALAHTSVPLPLGFQDAFPNILLTEDFFRTIELPSPPLSSSLSLLEGAMDDYIRPLEWLLVPTPLNLLMWWQSVLLKRTSFSTESKIQLKFDFVSLPLAPLLR